MDKIPELLRADLEAIKDPATKSLVVFAIEQAREGLREGGSQNQVAIQVSDQLGRRLNKELAKQ